MNLSPIRDYIAASSNMIVGRDLFVYSMPATVKRGVLLVTESAGNHVLHETPGAFEGRYQIIVRDPDYEKGYARAEEMFDMLNLIEMDLTTYVVTYSRPRHTPLPFSRSSGDLIEFSINFDFRYRIS